MRALTESSPGGGGRGGDRPGDRGARRPRSQHAARAASRDRPWLLSPIDLHVVKAAGVTFPVSMLERVIEERARGDQERRRRDPGRDPGDDRRLARHPAARLGRGRRPQGVPPRPRLVEPVPRGRASAPTPRSSPRRPCSRRSAPASTSACSPPRRGTTPSPRSCSSWHPTAASSARASATTSTCATSRGAARCCSARPRTTTRRPRSARSSASSTRATTSTRCGPRRGRPVPAPVRRGLRPRHGPVSVVTLSVAGDDGYRLEGTSELARISRDPAELVAAGDRRPPPVPRRIRALPRHDVRPGRRPR